MNHVVKNLSWKWDKAAGVLWASVVFTDGATASVGLPLAQVVASFDAAAVSVGLQLPAFVGSVESVDGLFSSIKKAVKGATKVVKSTVKKAVKLSTAHLKEVAKAGAVVVRSKYTTAVLGGLAVAFPAVGGPALLAQQAAARALAIAKQANEARGMIAAGMRSVGITKAARNGDSLRTNVKRLASSNNPASRMALAALRTF